jgi:hypothetical protein
VKEKLGSGWSISRFSWILFGFMINVKWYRQTFDLPASNLTWQGKIHENYNLSLVITCFSHPCIDEISFQTSGCPWEFQSLRPRQLMNRIQVGKFEAAATSSSA